MSPAPHRGSSGDKNKPRGGSSGGYGRPSGSRTGGPNRAGGSRPTSGGQRPSDDRGPRSSDDRGERAPRRSFDDRPQRSYSDRPQGGQGRPSGDRPQRSFDDRPPRSYGDRPQGDRPQRSSGDRPQGDRPQRSYGDRPPRSYDDRPPRSYGDRPQGDRPQRSYGDRPQGGQGRASGDRPQRSYDDRPPRSYGDRPQGDRPQRSYGDRPQGGQGRPSGDRPQRSYDDRPPRSYGDRPQGDRPQRSYGDRPQGGQGRPSGDRPQRSSNDRPDRSGRGRYDNNRGANPRGDRDVRPTRPAGPSIPADVTGQELDKEIRNDLRTLSLEAAEIVSRHLVMTARLLDDRPDLAWEHAKAAVARGGRLAVVREAAGIAAYTAGEYADALAQFRAARRISGSDSYWPIMADCERGLGRPERAISMAGADEVDRLDRAGRVEMRIVASGARRDLGQLEAAVVTLQCPELSSSSTESWSARLKFAYADALLAAGREDEAREWFAKTVEVDASDETDASERLADLDGIVWVDTLDEDEEDDETFIADADADLDDGDNVGEFAPPAVEDDASGEANGIVADTDTDLELDIDDLALAGDDPADYASVLGDQDLPDSSSD